jgi:hypothetical protein
VIVGWSGVGWLVGGAWLGWGGELFRVVRELASLLGVESQHSCGPRARRVQELLLC